jgi:hypothetical protein
MPCPSHIPQFDHTNNFLWRVQLMKPLTWNHLLCDFLFLCGISSRKGAKGDTVQYRGEGTGCETEESEGQFPAEPTDYFPST